MPAPALRIASDGDKALPKRFNFTMAKLERLACPGGKSRIYVYDEHTAHLALAVTAAGRKSWYFVAKHDGEVKRFRLGAFPAVNVDTARKLAAKHTVAYAEGNDPLADRRAARGAVTLDELWQDYKAKHAETHCSPRTQLTDENRFANHLQAWSNRRVAKITTADCIELHNAIAKASGKGSANRCLQLLRRLFNHAGLPVNPIGRRFRFFPEASRTRYLEPDELRRFFEALDHVDDFFDKRGQRHNDGYFRDFFRLALYTGARRGNVQAMRWDAIDFDRGIWRIDAQEFKAKRPVDVPLSAEALEILKRRREAGLSDVWVFPSRGKTGHLQEPAAAWRRVLAAAKLQDLRVHDLRHTAATYQLASGADLHTIGATLGHANASTTARYAHVRLDGMRKSIAAATAAMAAAAKTATPDAEAKP